MNILRRGSTYHLDATIGGRRVRASLGCTDLKAARRLADRIGYAVADGPKSEIWRTLKLVLPQSSYKILTKGLGLTACPNLAEFESRYLAKLDNRVRLGALAGSSASLYEKCLGNFFGWLLEEKVQLMDDLTPDLIEKYFVWRKNSILARPQSKNAGSLAADRTALLGLFNMAVEEGMITRNPVQVKPQSDGSPKGAEPFTPEEMRRLESNAVGEYLLPFLLLKWTGLRGGDACALRWEAVDLVKKSINWTTQKRATVVCVPIADPLYNCLLPLKGDPLSQVLGGLTRDKLYRLMLELGEKSGVADSNPHRFRDTLAVTMLLKGATIYDVSKVLGDQVQTVEKHYAPFTTELQDRVRNIFNSAGQEPEKMVA